MPSDLTLIESILKFQQKIDRLGGENGKVGSHGYGSIDIATCTKTAKTKEKQQAKDFRIGTRVFSFNRKK